MNNNSILKVENLNVKLNGEKIIEDLSFEVKEGETLAILGPNGAGKTVLFRTLLGFLPFEGEIQWKLGLKISYVPAGLPSSKDIPLTVKEFFDLKKSSQKEAVIEALSAVGLKNPEVLGKQVSFLSTGQFQRLLVAWGLYDNPQVLLFDEPMTGIDIGGQESVYNLLEKLKKERDLTILFVTHELSIVYKLADKVLCLSKRMLCHGLPKEILTPERISELYSGEIKFYQHNHK